MQALVLHPSGAGVAIAAIALAAGAPLFSDGLAALRLRRRFGALRHAALGDRPSGVVHVSGRVALESPLFAPLSGRPCAGFRLAVTTAQHPEPQHVDEWRDFRIVEEDTTAHVRSRSARWDLMVTGWRDVPAGDRLTEHLHALLDRVPETRWLRDSGAPLRLVEHALLAGGACHVVGMAHRATTQVFADQVVLARTGTDDAEVTIDRLVATATAHGAPDLWIGPDEASEFLLIADSPPRLERLHVPLLRLAGLALGPALSLAGMLYLARAADWLRMHGGF